MTRRIEAAPNSGAESRFTWIALGILVLLLIALQFRLWSGKASWAEVAELRERLDARRGEIALLEAQNASLEGEVRVLKSGPESLESRARSELGMIRSGETFFLVLPEAQGSPRSPAQTD